MSELEMVPIDEIEVRDRHRRELGDIDELAKSIADVGLLQPIVITVDSVLVAGERRLQAVRRLGRDRIEAYVVDNLNDAAALLRAERDENICRKAFTPTEEHSLYEALLALEKPKAEERVAQGARAGGEATAGRAPEKVSQGRAKEQAAEAATGNAGRYKTLDKVGEVKAIAADDTKPETVRELAKAALQEMDQTGRVDGAYQRVKQAVSENDLLQEQEDDVPLEPLAPGWHELGPHRLYCGDSTDQVFIDACRGAAFAFADPPYNVGKADWDHGFTWQHDYLAEIASIVAVTPGNASLRDFHKVTTMPYQWSLAVEITNGMTRGALGFANWIYVALFSSGSLYRNAKDVLRVPAHTADDEGGTHPTRKPFRMMTDLIGLFTSKGDTVVDPFLGSGTTLLAADRLGRVCIGAEIDPMYCAEIVARYRKAHRR